MTPMVDRGALPERLWGFALAAMVACTLMALPAQAAKLERLKIAVAPLGWDTNFTWLQSRSGQLDKRPALEYLVGIDRHTGAYIPELAEKWHMAPDGKSWTITLGKGVKSHDNWGEFAASTAYRNSCASLAQGFPQSPGSYAVADTGTGLTKWPSRDVRHSVFLITQPEAVGLQPKLVEIDFPRVREQYRTKTIHGSMWPSRPALRALDTARIFHKQKESVVYSYEHPYIEERLEALGKVVDTAQRTQLLREIGDHKFTEFVEIPLFWLLAEATVNPKYIAEYVFPGVITGFFTHLEYVKLAP